MEVMPCDWKSPEGALPAQYCKYHIATKENPAGTDCSAQLKFGIVFECPFKTPDEAINGVILEDRTRGSECADFVLRSFASDRNTSKA